MIHVDHYRASAWGGAQSDRTISAVPATDRAFIVVHGGAAVSAVQRSSRWAHSARLLDASTVRLNRGAGTGASDAETSFSVVWCDADEFRVEHLGPTAAAMTTAASVDAALSGGPYDPDRTMVLVSASNVVTAAAGDRFAWCTALLLAGGASVRVLRGDGSETLAAGVASTTAMVQVVEWSAESGVTVEAGTDDLSADLSAGVTVAYTPGDIELVLMLWQQRHLQVGLEQNDVQCRLTSSGRTYRRHTTANVYQSWVRWQAVKFPESRGVRVGRGELEAGSAVASGDVASSLPALPAGLVLLSASCAGTGTNFPRHAWWVESRGTGTANAARGWTGNESRVAVQFADLAAFAIPEPPEADFSGSPLSGTYPLAVSFEDASSGGPVETWEWDFGDGGTSTEQYPVHEYADAGTYTVSLTVTGPGGSDTLTRTDYVSVGSPAPVADFDGSPTSGEYPLLVDFTDASTGPITGWSWEFGDGGSSTDQSPSHTYTAAGLYTVSLTVTGPGGEDTLERDDYVTVTAPPEEPSVGHYEDDEHAADVPQTHRRVAIVLGDPDEVLELLLGISGE